MRRRGLRFWLAALTLLAACAAPEARQAKLFADADAAAAEGDLPRAISRLRSAVAYDPRDVEAATRLADVLVRANRSREARALLERIPPELDADARLSNLRARVLLRQGRPETALPILLGLSARGEADPESTRALIEGLAACRATPDSAPDLPVDWRLDLIRKWIEAGANDLAAKWLRTLPESSSDRDRLVDTLLAAVLGTDLQKMPASIVELALSADTANKLLVLRRHLAAGRNLREAYRIEAEFLAAYPDHPAWPAVAISSARHSLRAGQPAVAERLSRQAAALDTGGVDPLVVRGLALRELGRESEARKSLSLALALDPSSETARRALSDPTREPKTILIEVDLQGRTPGDS